MWRSACTEEPAMRSNLTEMVSPIRCRSSDINTFIRAADSHNATTGIKACVFQKLTQFTRGL